MAASEPIIHSMRFRQFSLKSNVAAVQIIMLLLSHVTIAFSWISEWFLRLFAPAANTSLQRPVSASTLLYVLGKSAFCKIWGMAVSRPQKRRALIDGETLCLRFSCPLAGMRGVDVRTFIYYVDIGTLMQLF